LVGKEFEGGLGKWTPRNILILKVCNFISVDELKKKWRGLRDTFGKELKKVNSKKYGQAAVSETDSRWPYFKNLLFLRGTMSRRDLKSSVPDNSDISDEELLTQTSTSSNFTASSSNCQSPEVNAEQTPKKTFKSPLKKKLKGVRQMILIQDYCKLKKRS